MEPGLPSTGCGTEDSKGREDDEQSQQHHAAGKVPASQWAKWSIDHKRMDCCLSSRSAICLKTPGQLDQRSSRRPFACRALQTSPRPPSSCSTLQKYEVVEGHPASQGVQHPSQVLGKGCPMLSGRPQFGKEAGVVFCRHNPLISEEYQRSLSKGSLPRACWCLRSSSSGSADAA